jgi:hypothetical protein
MPVRSDPVNSSKGAKWARKVMAALDRALDPTENDWSFLAGRAQSRVVLPPLT